MWYKRVMASKNSVKIYIENGYYHLYNRGVEKRIIFGDDQDYSVLLGYLHEYLGPKDEIRLYDQLAQKGLEWKEKEKILRLLRLNSFFGEIDLVAYCLMPNHFHFLVKQNRPESIDKFTNSLLTRYAGYFNRKYQRVGRLFQDVYKAVLVTTDEQLLNLSRYIHRNPLELGENARMYQSKYTSLPEYLGKRNTPWVKSKEILNYFSKINSKDSYLSFVEQTDDLEALGEIALEMQ